VCLGLLLSMYNATVVNVMLPDIRVSLHASGTGLGGRPPRRRRPGRVPRRPQPRLHLVAALLALCAIIVALVAPTRARKRAQGNHSAC
jgi:hypothetical protein